MPDKPAAVLEEIRKALEYLNVAVADETATADEREYARLLTDAERTIVQCSVLLVYVHDYVAVTPRDVSKVLGVANLSSLTTAILEIGVVEIGSSLG